MKNRNVKFGVFLPTFAGGDMSHHDCPYYNDIDWPLTCDFANTVEKLGFDSIWMCDHVMLGKDQAIFEGWTSLSYLAAITRRVAIGTFLVCNSYRNPALVAKMASTLDIVSGGRLHLGLGAGWHKDEYDAYGFQFLSPAERVASLGETIQVIKRLWTEDKVTFKGKFCEVKGAVCNPKPAQKPHPPIMIGAWGRKMLELTAEQADSWNIADDPSPSVFREKSSVIESRCNKIGRRFDEIERTWSGHIIVEKDRADVRKRIEELSQIMGGTQMQLPSGEIAKVDPQYLIDSSIHGTPKDCIRQVSEIINAGAEHFIMFFWDFPSKHALDLFANYVMPGLKKGQHS